MTALADLCSSVDYGYTASASDDPSTGPKFLRITDIVPEFVDWTSVPHCAIEDKKREKFLLDPGDIVVARTGATVGYAKQIWARPEGATFASYLVRFRPDPSKVDPYYLGQVVQSGAFKNWVKSVAGGAAQPNANAKLLGTFDVPLPETDIQRRIGSALRAIVELIENNRRRIEILEAMARLIYREWFGHYRFPSHQDVELVDSALGPIPKGWDVRPVGEVIDTVGGGTPSKEKPEYWSDPSIAWYTPSDLTKRSVMFAFGSSDQINEVGLAKSSAKLFPARTVMMTSRATIGEIAIATTEASTNQGFISCVPNERLSEYHLYFWLQENVELFHTLAGGATFKELRKSTFRDLLVVVPPIAVESEFTKKVGPMCNLIENLLRQSDLLGQARDLLLPRLISGHLDVSDLDLDLEPVA